MSQRPMTSKPRGVCMYFRSSGGCRNGDMCKFLHGEGEALSPYDKSKTCKFYAAGFCKHGDKCWFRHTNDTNDAQHSGNQAPADSSTSEEGTEESEAICSICQEKPVTYGLLEDCSHVFCLECIRGWRDPSGKTADIVASGNTKRCPYCRASSNFVTPSSIFYPCGHPMKEATIANYKASMSRIPCRYFARSSPGSRFCPFGKDCFYQHKEEDGTLFKFEHGAGYHLRKSRRRRNRTPEMSLLDMLSDFRQRDRDEMTQVLLDMRAHLESAYFLQEIPHEVEDSFPELARLLIDVTARLGTAVLVATSSEDEHNEDGQSLPSRPSIFASPEDSTTGSALPLTRAFMDNNFSFNDDYLAEAQESENETPADVTDTPHMQTTLFQPSLREHNLSDVDNAWTDEGLDYGEESLVHIPGSDIGGSDNNIEHDVLAAPLPGEDIQDQENPIPSSRTSNNEPQMINSLNCRDSPAQDLVLNGSVSPGSLLRNTQSLPSLADHTPIEDNQFQELEVQSRPETRSEPAPRRSKSASRATQCSGRRNGGQSFVTDGRGRVVATDDLAYADGAPLAYWSLPASVIAPPTDSTSEMSIPASAGLGALDDLD